MSISHISILYLAQCCNTMGSELLKVKTLVKKRKVVSVYWKIFLPTSEGCK